MNGEAKGRYRECKIDDFDKIIGNLLLGNLTTLGEQVRREKEEEEWKREREKEKERRKGVDSVREGIYLVSYSFSLPPLYDQVSEGKSGSLFFWSHNSRFAIKTISRDERIVPSLSLSLSLSLFLSLPLSPSLSLCLSLSLPFIISNLTLSTFSSGYADDVRRVLQSCAKEPRHSAHALHRTLPGVYVCVCLSLPLSFCECI